MGFIRFILVSVLFGAILPAEGQAQEGRHQAPFPRDRDAMQQRFQKRLADVVRDRVGLDQEQMAKLMELNGRFETKRRGIFEREREIRLGMRDELAEGTTPNDDRVRKLLDDQLRVQRERVDLVEAEQGELAKFLTPTQRARYFGIQEQMRRKVEELRGPMGTPPDADLYARRRAKRLPRDSSVR